MLHNTYDEFEHDLITMITTLKGDLAYAKEDKQFMCKRVEENMTKLLKHLQEANKIVTEYNIEAEMMMNQSF